MIRRAWRVYADPPASTAAADLRWLIPIEIIGFLYRIAVPEPWLRFEHPTPVVVILLYVMLWIVRQRDEARAALKDLQPVE